MIKTALCIGNNRYPAAWGADLAGCVPDAKNLAAELQARGWGVTLLLNASRNDIMDSAGKVIAAAGEGGSWAITFSGHGTQVPDVHGDETDGLDEASCCSDGNLILDDEWWKIFRGKPVGSSGFFLSDSCHSGTVARATKPLKQIVEDGVVIGTRKFVPYRVINPEAWATEGPTRDLDAPRLFSPVAEEGWGAKEGGARVPWPVLLMSGCQDDEYSYDAVINGRPCGAFTYTALWVLKNLKPGATFNEWFVAIRGKLPSKQYPQTPRLIGSYLQKPALFG